MGSGLAPDGSDYLEPDMLSLMLAEEADADATLLLSLPRLLLLSLPMFRITEKINVSTVSETTTKPTRWADVFSLEMKKRNHV